MAAQFESSNFTAECGKLDNKEGVALGSIVSRWEFDRPVCGVVI